jgi:hypothetical protein
MKECVESTYEILTNELKLRNKEREILLKGLWNLAIDFSDKYFSKIGIFGAKPNDLKMFKKSGYVFFFQAIPIVEFGCIRPIIVINEKGELRVVKSPLEYKSNDLIWKYE